MKKDSVMKKLFKYIGKYWILLILSIILAGISVVLQLYVPVLFGNAIDEIVAAHNVDYVALSEADSSVRSDRCSRNLDHEPYQ